MLDSITVEPKICLEINGISSIHSDKNISGGSTDICVNAILGFTLLSKYLQKTNRMF
jgi:hypothetical protein